MLYPGLEEYAVTELVTTMLRWSSSVFTLCGALMYHWVGNQYMTAPAFGSLQDTYKKIAFSFAIPTIVFLGSLYASVSARFWTNRTEE